MRWNCPHCGINLAVTDEKLGTGWSFSRCYKCGGFALVRRSDVNLIKVDRAPTGEKVLLPEASEEPMMSHAAAQNLARYVGGASVPASQQNGAGAVAAGKPIIRPAARRAKTDVAAQNVAAKHASSSTLGKLSSALGNVTRPSQELLAGVNLPEPLPDEPIPAQSRILPAAIGIAGALSIASGIYLYIQGQALWHKARVSAGISQPAPASAPAPATADREAHDSVKTSAAAPAAAEPAAPASLTIQSGQAAAAPVKESPSPMMIKLLVRNANLHSGPGLSFPIVGKGDVDHDYAVAEWRDRWFKIVLSAQQTAWVRNDLVQRVPQQK